MEQSRSIQEAIGLLTRAGYIVSDMAVTVEVVTTIGIEGCNKSGVVLRINGGEPRTVRSGVKIVIAGPISDGTDLLPGKQGKASGAAKR